MNDIMKEELEEANKKHIEFLESQDFEILGINVFKAFAYELVQVLNHEWLKERLNK